MITCNAANNRGRPLLLLLLFSLGLLGMPARAQQCAEPPASQLITYAPRVSMVVTGKGRLQFHSAPADHCEMKGVFIIPGDQVIAYDAYRKWSSVMFTHPKTGEDTLGWVETSRLKMIGTIGPR